MSTRPTLSALKPLERRYEIVWLFDVQNGNPNGDPDADNQPRVDPETGHGLVTDVAIKRKLRNYVTLTRSGQPHCEIYVKERGILANEQRKAYTAEGIDPDGKNIDRARAWMCKNFYDVRTFGAVMTTGKAESEEENGHKSKAKNSKFWNCGQVRGPVQFAFSRSIDPVFSIAHTITRVALTNASDTKQESQITESGEERAASGQMGRKHGVLYGLYRMHGFVSPFLGRDTGFTEADLGLLMEALANAFTHDRSAARGEMTVRRLYLFEHSSELGNAPAHHVFETIQLPSVKTPRSFAEYESGITEPEDGAEVLPGVRAWRWV
jgi:CRISPR-associated protein Csd2